MILKKAGLGIFLLVSMMQFAQSAYLKCGNKYVHQGDSEYVVIQKCGEPFYTSRGGRNWFYEQSRGAFVREVIFNAEGKVMRINMVNPGT